MNQEPVYRTRPPKHFAHPKGSFLDFLQTSLNLSNRSLNDLAAEVGYESGNALTLIKSGRSKIALNRVRPLGRALGIDDSLLYQLALRDQFPDIWENLQQMGTKNLVSDTERELLEQIKKVVSLDRLAREPELVDKVADGIAIAIGRKAV
jgi:hypothetical protein